jgi:nitroreductase
MLEMDVLEALLTRCSAIQLSDPAPTDDALTKMFQAAVRAPDHGRLKPWRFLTIRGDARNAFGDLLVEGLRRREPQATDAQLDSERRKPLRAPVLIVVVAVERDTTRVPRQEQIAAVDAATQNLVLAAHGLGYGAFWRTGAIAYDPHVKAGLGLSPADHIVGIVYIGTVLRPGVPRAAEIDGYVVDWQTSLV